jgi:hypothetical protein
LLIGSDKPTRRIDLFLDGGLNYTNLSHSREISTFFDLRQTVQKRAKKALTAENPIICLKMAKSSRNIPREAEI